MADTHIAEVFASIESDVQKFMSDHARQPLWFPSDYVVPRELEGKARQEYVEGLKEKARAITPEIRAVLALNLLTEEGLPLFHGLLASYLGRGSPWMEWNNLWTAEEDRHGAGIHDYALYANLFIPREMERLRYTYLSAGFNPAWESPYELIAYTVLQERATQLSHRNTARLLETTEPVLSKLLSRIATDEARHYAFYRRVFQKIMEYDPNNALIALQRVMRKFDMPGRLIPGYDDFSHIAQRSGVFGPADYRDIVEEVTSGLRIKDLSGLDEKGEVARGGILKIRNILERGMLRKPVSRTITLSFLCGAPTIEV